VRQLRPRHAQRRSHNRQHGGEEKQDHATLELVHQLSNLLRGTKAVNPIAGL
jgi:hypothetical protein